MWQSSGWHPSFILSASAFKSVPRRGGGWVGKACTNYRGPAFRKGAWGPTVFHMFLSFSVLSVLPTLQINPFILSPSHSETDSQSFRFNVKVFFWRSAFVGRWGEGEGVQKIFHRYPKPLLVGLIQISTQNSTWLILFRVLRHFLQTGTGTHFELGHSRFLPRSYRLFVHCSSYNAKTRALISWLTSLNKIKNAMNAFQIWRC